MTIGLSPIVSTAEAFAWIDAAGTVHPFTDATGYQVLPGVHGRWFPPVAWIEDAAPGLPGTVLRGVERKPLDWDLPIYVNGDSPAQLHQRKRDLMYWLDPSRGDGAFQNTAADGETRVLYCRSAGVDFVEDNPAHCFVVVSMHAPEPYWYAPAATSESYAAMFGAPVPFLSSPFFPLNLTSTVLFAGPTIDNPGDVESWPTWTVIGPGTNPSLRNTTTGEVLTFTRTLAAGDMIVATIARDSFTVTDGLGTRLYSTVSNASIPWSIRPGINRLQLGMEGATNASSITLAYTARFIGP